FAQIVTAAVRVKVGAFQGFAHGGESLRRGPERILVRGKLDDLLRLQTDLACHVFDRFPRFIGNQITKLRIGEVPNGHRSVCKMWTEEGEAQIIARLQLSLKSETHRFFIAPDFQIPPMKTISLTGGLVLLAAMSGLTVV